MVNEFTQDLMIRNKNKKYHRNVNFQSNFFSSFFSLLNVHHFNQHICFSQLGDPVPMTSHSNNEQNNVSLSQCTLVIEFYQRYIKRYTTSVPVGQTLLMNL